MQEQVIKEVGAQNNFNEALIQKQNAEKTALGNNNDVEVTREMFLDIQQRLSELSAIEKCQKQFDEMKRQHLKQLEALNEASKRE